MKGIGSYARDVIVPPDLDIVVPAQWAPPPVTRRGAGPSRLGAAALREAWFALRAPRESPVHQQAVVYFLAPADDTVPLPFEHACALAGVEPERIRRLVRAQLEVRR